MSASVPGGARSSGARALAMAALGVVGAVVLLVLAIAFFGSARDGDPHVTLALPAFTRAPNRQAVVAPPQVARYAGGNLVADPALISRTDDGPVPVIAPDGRTPMQAYARPFDTADKRPRIAIVMTALGVSQSGTQLALVTAPPALTMAFVPFAPNVQALVDQARAKGHEVLLEVPMEPFDYPASDPGPHGLLVSASAKENARRLDWSLARITGYVGVANLLGGRYLGETSAIEPTLEILAKHGLLFFDDGSASNSVARTAARHAGTHIATATVTLDEVQTPAAIDAQLRALEQQARENGFAVGTCSFFPVTLDRLSQWADGLEQRGFVLAPLSAVATNPRPAAPAESKGK